jgi:hypothetical protein
MGTNLEFIKDFYKIYYHNKGCNIYFDKSPPLYMGTDLKFIKDFYKIYYHNKGCNIYFNKSPPLYMGTDLVKNNYALVLNPFDL